jgi:hypothetical protein
MTEKPDVDFEKVLADSGMPSTEAEITAVFKSTVQVEGLSPTRPECHLSGG